MPCLRDAIFYFKVFSCHKLCGLNVSATFTTELVAVLKYTVFFKVRIQESTFTIIWWKWENGACWCHDVYLNVSKYCVWIIICLCRPRSTYCLQGPKQGCGARRELKFQVLAPTPKSIFDQASEWFCPLKTENHCIICATRPHKLELWNWDPNFRL